MFPKCFFLYLFFRICSVGLFLFSFFECHCLKDLKLQQIFGDLINLSYFNFQTGDRKERQNQKRVGFAWDYEGSTQ